MIWKATGGHVLFINKFAVNLRLPWFLLLLRQNVDLRRMNTTGVQLLRILWSNDSDTNSERGWKIH